jgi:hypothetical protein
MLKISLIASLVSLSTVFTSSAHALVTNGGFEAGLAGWTTTGFSTSSFFLSNSGSLAASSGFVVSSPASLSQTLATAIGQEYQLSFFLNTLGGTPNQFRTLIGGNEISNLVNITTNGYVNYNFNFTATSGSTLLEFRSGNDPFANSLDDVSVTEVTPIPFEFSPALGLGVLGGLFAAKKLSSKLLKK